MTGLRRPLMFCALLIGMLSGVSSAWGQEVSLETLDSYILKVYETLDEAAYPEAESVYYTLLSRLDTPLEKDAREIVERHAAQAMLVVPDRLRSQILKSDRNANTLSFNADAGRHLVAWWRSQDPLPATPENERLNKHLERVAEAMESYDASRRQSGLDDRGEIYVRLGKPRTASPVRLDAFRIKRELDRRQVNVSGSMTSPDGEFWDYTHLGESSYYFFVKEGAYKLGHPSDLIPDVLMRRISRGGTRGGLPGQDYEAAVGVVLSEALRLLYTELAPMHPDYLAMLEEVTAYESDLGGRSNTYATTLRNKIRNQDRLSEERRERFTPKAYAPVVEDQDPLQVEARIARFLDPDGSTRAEIYWSHRPGTLTLSGRARERATDVGYDDFDQFLLALASVRYSPDWTERTETFDHYLAADRPPGSDAPIQTQTLRGNTDLFHLGLQWNQHAVAFEPSTGEALVGPMLKTGVVRADSLPVLKADPGTLEISDLRPIYIPNGLADVPEQDTPFPMSIITNETPLALYFETYHLALDADDQSHYTVELVVEREGERGLLRLRDRDEPRTSVSTSFAGSSSTARDRIELDLSEWEGRGQLNITIRVTDEETGQQAERSIQFDLDA